MIKNSKTLKNIEWRNPEGDVRTLPRPHTPCMEKAGNTSRQQTNSGVKTNLRLRIIFSQK